MPAVHFRRAVDAPAANPISETRMAFFSKPPARKKPEPAKADARPQAGPATADGRAASARELAAQAAHAGGRRHVEPAGGDLTITGASLVQWAPAQSSFEVAQANPGLCAVLENAALRYAGGPDRRCPPAARGRHRERHRHQAFGACLARAVRPVAAPGRQGGVRPARAAVRRAVRALGAGMGGGRKAEPRAARVRRHGRGDRTADRGLGNADRGHPARDFTASARGAARSRVGDRFRRRRRAPARQCIGRRPAGGAGTAVAGGNQTGRRARRGDEERSCRGRGRVAAGARDPAVGRRPRGVRGSRDRVCGGLRAFAAVMGAAAGVPGRAEGEGRGAGGARASMRPSRKC